MNDDSKLLAFILSKIGMTENEVRWMYQQGASFRKDEWEIRQYLFDEISLPKCFLQELEVTLEKEEILDLLSLKNEDIDDFFRYSYLDKYPQYPKYYPSSAIEIIYSPELKWNLFLTSFTNKYNLLSFYDSKKELRNSIMKNLNNEKKIDYPEIARIFGHTARYVRDTLSKE